MKTSFDQAIYDACTNKSFILSIDQGTSSTRCVLINQKGLIVASAQMEHAQHFPSAGWHEHDPAEIWKNTVACMKGAVDVAQEKIGAAPTVLAVGITNQRETTVAWNKTTGKAYYNAVVWDCQRTAPIATQIADGNGDRLRDKTGLPVASYFAGTKVKWLLDNVSELRDDIAKNPDQVAFGTIDSWLLWNLTAGTVHGTDVSNASRWLFVDLKKPHEWDQGLVDIVCAPHKLPVSMLPKISASGAKFGTISNKDCPLQGVPVAGILGDQQAALFGQAGYKVGQAKNTYGTGLFLMMNTGTEQIPSKHGLLTTVAYQTADDQPVVYALEGSVSHAGSTVQWLRDQLKILEKASDCEKLIGEIKDEPIKANDRLYLVPAFAGLFAPYWRSDARACMVGMTTQHDRKHVIRAAVESMAYQTAEVFGAMEKDSQQKLSQLAVDGGATANDWLLQFQADILNVPVIRPAVLETTAMGAAFMAGLGVGMWASVDDLAACWAQERKFSPEMKEEDRKELYDKGWKRAVSKSMNWIE